MTEGKYHLGEEMEVFDAELYAIEKATDIAEGYTADHREIKKVWILLDNQEAVRRIQKTKAGPGQNMILSTRRGILTLQGSDVKMTVQWVPGHVKVPGNQNAD